MHSILDDIGMTPNIYHHGDRKVGGHNREFLRKTYFDDKKTAEQICAELKCSKATVLRALRKIEGFEIEAQHRMREGRKKTKPKKILLSAAKVIEARQRYKAGGVTYAKLASDYNATVRSIQGAVTGESWKHLDNIELPAKIDCPPNKLVNAHEVNRLHRSEGKTLQQIAEDFGLPERTVVNAFQHAGYRVDPMASNHGKNRHTPETYSIIHAKIRGRKCDEYTKSLLRRPRPDKTKLNAKQVIEARRRYKMGGITYREMQADYPGISVSTLQIAVSGGSWKHLDKIETPAIKGLFENRNVLCAEQVIEARQRYKMGGITYREILADYPGVAYITLAEAIVGKTWKCLNEREAPLEKTR